jgi:hypothetical protein
MTSERRNVERNVELSIHAREALRLVYTCMSQHKGIKLTPDLLEIWSNHRKAPTVNQYANNFYKRVFNHYLS